jgi:hypothetical protein
MPSWQRRKIRFEWESQFESNWWLVVQRFLLIEDQSRYPSIPWRDIVGMRNRLVHGYDAIDLDVLRDTAQVDLPQGIGELKRILRSTIHFSQF